MVRKSYNQQIQATYLLTYLLVGLRNTQYCVSTSAVEDLFYPAVVYLLEYAYKNFARDVSLDKEVAIKFCKSFRSASESRNFEGIFTSAHFANNSRSFQQPNSCEFLRVG